MGTATETADDVDEDADYQDETDYTDDADYE